MARRARNHGGQVTLVNPARFTERLRMRQIATGQQLPDLQLADLLAGIGVEFVQGWASRIDLETREVRVDTADGRSLPFDSLVYLDVSGS